MIGHDSDKLWNHIQLRHKEDWNKKLVNARALRPNYFDEIDKQTAMKYAIALNAEVVQYIKAF